MCDAREPRVASLYGALLGAAVGDALGIAYERLSPRRATRLFPLTDAFHLLPGVGLIPDNAEHVMMTAAKRRALCGERAFLARRRN